MGNAGCGHKQQNRPGTSHTAEDCGIPGLLYFTQDAIFGEKRRTSLPSGNSLQLRQRRDEGRLKKSVSITN